MEFLRTDQKSITMRLDTMSSDVNRFSREFTKVSRHAQRSKFLRARAEVNRAASATVRELLPLPPLSPQLAQAPDNLSTRPSDSWEHHMKSAVPTIYLDEAGNTGAHLLDPQQPVFTLASVNLSPDECSSLLDPIATPQAKEAKFTSLRKTSSGRDKLLKFVSSAILTPQRAKLATVNKTFMVVSKLVDLLIETQAYNAGFNLYENGTNLAISHLLFYTAPGLCGREKFDHTLTSFVAMIRHQSPETKQQFFASVDALHQAGRHPSFRLVSDLLRMAEPQIDDLLENIDSSALDPAIPAFFYLCSDWGRQLRAPFHVVHDSSKPIAASQELLEAMMTQAVEPSLIGVDRRKFEFPLRASGIRFADSKAELGLQVSDLLAGTMAYFAARVAAGSPDEFCMELEAAGVERFTVMNIWPEPKVTPEELGTVPKGVETDAADAMVEIMKAMVRNRD